MGFRDARHEAIKALEEGRVQHEARNEIDEKNLLLTGDVTPQQAVLLLKACRGTEHSCSSHHHVKGIDVHVFRPVASLIPRAVKVRWYIKLYFVEPDVWFISVHKSK